LKVAAARIRIVARLGENGSGLSPFVVGSLCAHLAFVAALVFLPSLRPRKAFPDELIVVDLVAAPRAAARVQPAAPPPTPAPRRDVARLETREPPAVTPLPDKPEPKPKQEPRPTAPPTPSAAETDPAPGEASGIVGELGGGALGALDGADLQFAWYRDSITAAFRSNWRRPILTGRIDPIEVRLSFDILRDGTVRNLRVEEPSGLSVFDRAALRAVSDASPLPPLPAAWREPVLPASWVFQMVPE
jgi:TonB family protein